MAERVNRGFRPAAGQGGSMQPGPSASQVQPGSQHQMQQAGAAGPVGPTEVLLPPKMGLRVGQLYAISIAWGVAYLLFLLVFFSLSFTYHKKIDTFIIASGALAVAAIYGFPASEARLRSTMWRWMPLLVCGLSVFLGVWIGESNYNWYMRHYYDLAYGHVYTNVLSSNAALNYADASLIRFSHDAHVDSTKMVGYLKDGELFCAAPVMSQSVSPNKPVTFWAIGRNCCEPKFHIFTCTSGVLNKQMTPAEFDATKTATLATFDANREQNDRENFLWAIKMANSRFALPPMTAADAVLFVNWSKDPTEDVDAFHQGGVLFFWIVSLVMGFLYSTIALLWRPGKDSPANPMWIVEQVQEQTGITPTRQTAPY